MNRCATLQAGSFPPPAKASLFDLSGRRRPHEQGHSYISLGVAPSDELEEYHAKHHQVGYENTYRMEPRNRFVVEKVEPILTEVLEKHLEKTVYEPIHCRQLAKTVVAEIKQQVKELNFERYKIVCLVDIGEKRSQDFHMGSRCLWDSQRDTFATASYENRSIFATAIVFAVYFE